MLKIKLLQIIIFSITSVCLAQQATGYWDKERVTNKEIKLSAGDKIIVKSEDFPVGTTEFVYRITLLDENQKMVNDLASVLKAIPDPYYIGKGTGGAITLVSAISGSDKCTYAIFSNNELATDFSKTGNVKKACLYQNNPVSKDAKVLSVEKSICLQEESNNIWFGFENTNWIMGEKIVLEIVPWIDIKASKIWTKTNKNKALIYLKTSEVASKLTNPDAFCYSLIEKIQEEYKYSTFQKLSNTEKKTLIGKYTDVALQETNNIEIYSKAIRDEANTLAKQGKYDSAIKLINQNLLSKTKKLALDYNMVAEFYLYTKQFDKALKSLENAIKIDPTELLVQLNLAHTYMLLDKISESKEIHKRYMDQNVNTNLSWKSKTISDLEEFKKHNLPDDNFKKILRVIN